MPSQDAITKAGICTVSPEWDSLMKSKQDSRYTRYIIHASLSRGIPTNTLRISQNITEIIFFASSAMIQHWLIQACEVWYCYQKNSEKMTICFWQRLISIFHSLDGRICNFFLRYCVLNWNAEQIWLFWEFLLSSGSQKMLNTRLCPGKSGFFGLNAVDFNAWYLIPTCW